MMAVSFLAKLPVPAAYPKSPLTVLRIVGDVDAGCSRSEDLWLGGGGVGSFLEQCAGIPCISESLRTNQTWARFLKKQAGLATWVLRDSPEIGNT